MVAKPLDSTSTRPFFLASSSNSILLLLSVVAYLDLEVTQKYQAWLRHVSSPHLQNKLFSQISSVSRLFVARKGSANGGLLFFFCLYVAYFFCCAQLDHGAVPPTLTLSSLLTVQVTQGCAGIDLYQLTGASCVCVSSQLHSMTLKLAMVAVFTPQESANAVNQDFVPEGQLSHLPRYTAKFTSAHFRKHIRQMKRMLAVGGKGLTVCTYRPSLLSPF